VGRKHIEKAAALMQVNEAIKEGALASTLPALDWDFFCECGALDCDQRVALTVDEYVALHDSGQVVLARGHRLTELGYAQRARRVAREAREAAEALRGQARQQRKRARRTLPGDEH
jgi:hypothetical protein